jgi:hypothetical protein
MFNIFRKKINIKNIRNYQDALEITNFYIEEKKWDEAHKLLKKIFITEKSNADSLIKKLDRTNIKKYEIKKNKILEILNKKNGEIKDLEIKLSKSESKCKIIPKSINGYDEAIRTVETLISLNNFEKAENLVNRIKEAEKL